MKTKTIYDPLEIEPRWQKWWVEHNIFQPDIQNAKRPFYNLMMFPYPSAEGLHVGNMYAFTGADIYGRFQRMQGYDVFEPIGLDGFGIHSENYAIKVGRHPIEHAKISEKHFYEQLHQIGAGFAWDNKLETYDPAYYRWTQWLFIQMYKHGLAYRKAARVNWCPSCKTVLSDEQVEGGACERCKSQVSRKEMEQWFFKITEYADRLLNNIPTLKWPKKITIAQQNWIGRTKGLTIDFKVDGIDKTITIWTKFWETIFGTTFLVLSPEHPIIKSLQIPLSQKQLVESYIQQASKKTEQQRKIEEKEKTGVFTGVHAINPANQEKVPVWISDYVLMSVGTGAVMGVPAHDERDFTFAKKHDLKIAQVVSYQNKEIDSKVQKGEMAYEGEGKLVNSGAFDGKDAWGAGKQEMATWMVEKGFAKWQTTHHLRDWLISRQRYWGPPIPMIFCAECAKKVEGKGKKEEGNTMKGWFSVPEEQLPVLLPYVKDFQPIGEGKTPLEKAPKEWLEVKCPNCGKIARRSTEVSDTFLDSSWYFLAYPNLKTDEWKRKKQVSRSAGQQVKKADNLSTFQPFNLSVTTKWLPVNAYIGGAEHAVLHLLYARFVWMCLKDWGYLSFGSSAKGRPASGWDEPFPFLFSHGLIIKDGAKMSKSRGNVVSPDDYIARYGADTLRMYLMFLGPYYQGGDFRDSGIAGMYRFLERVWKAFQKQGQRSSTLRGSDPNGMKDEGKGSDKEIKSLLNRTIKRATEDYSKFKFNTIIASLMEFMNLWEGRGGETPMQLSKEDALSFLKLLSPIAPHITDELYHLFDQKAANSIHQASWPSIDESVLSEETVGFPVQVNGKTRAVLTVSASMARDEQEMVRRAQQEDRVRKYIENKKILKQIFVPNKTINFVI